MSKQKITVTIPERLEDVTIRQVAQYMAGDLEDNSKALESAISIFCGIDAETQKRIVKSQLNDIQQAITAILNERPSVRTKFEHNGVKYGLVTSLEEITAGEYIDVEQYISDWSNMHKAVAVMYRPIVKEYKGFYEIEPYEGSHKHSGALQDAPASIAVGLMLFFWTIGNELLNATVNSLNKAAMDAGLTEVHNLQLSGVGTLPSSTLRGEMFSYLTKLLTYRYTHS